MPNATNETGDDHTGEQSNQPITAPDVEVLSNTKYVIVYSMLYK